MINVGQSLVDRTCTFSSPQCWTQVATPGVDIRVWEAWQLTTGSPFVAVAILDSGVEYCNPDLDPARFLYPDIALTCEGNESYPPPCCEIYPCDYGMAGDLYGHGTFIAGILGAVANNGIGIAGVDQQCKILAARTMGRSIDEPQYALANVGRMIIALERIASMQAYESVRVINWSVKFDCPDPQSEDNQFGTLNSALALLRAQNRFVIASSTNDGVGGADASCPNSSPDVITVGGIDGLGWRVAPPCGFGASGTGTALDFVAPGMAHLSLGCQSNPRPNHPHYPTSPCSTQTAHHLNFASGTSYAVPMVCGAVSLILARAINLGIVSPVTWQGLDWDDVYDILRAGARDRVSWGVPGVQGDPFDAVGPDPFYGWGLIDIRASLDYLQAQYCPPCN